MLDKPTALTWLAADLAPGDTRSGRLGTAGLVLNSIRQLDDPAFRAAYQFLETKFGQTGALETIEVLAQRFAWPAGPQADGWTLQYEMISVLDAAGAIAAVRDHTVAVPPRSTDNTPAEVIVHLSHVLVAEPWRRSGLGGWLRAFPLQAGRKAWRETGSSDQPLITLIAEMEAAPTAPNLPPASLLAYERAGFRKLDPALISYCQPDFHSPAEIDRAGGPRPLPFSLVLRRVGRESETAVSGAETRALALAIYRVYRDGCRPADLAPLLDAIDRSYPAPGDVIRLVPPSAP